MDIRQLAKFNPWWTSPSAIDDDPHIRSLGSSKITWVPELMAEIDLGRDAIITIRGPRQVGKTTLMKLWINELLKKGVEGSDIVYLTCESLSNGAELADTVEGFLVHSRRLQGDTRKYLMIDEVSSIGGWEKPLKVLVDRGMTRSAFLALTGSHSMDLKRSIESLPGRRGEGSGRVNFVMWPLSFREFLAAAHPELHDRLLFGLDPKMRIGMVRNLALGKLDDVFAAKIAASALALEAALGEYLLTGGLAWPMRVFYGADTRTILDSVYELYIRALCGDLARFGYRETAIRQIAAVIIQSMTTRISLNGVAEKTDLGSHNTVSSYLEAMEDAFALMTILSYDLDKGRMNPRRERKVYPADPFMYHALQGWTQGRSDYLAQALEALADPEHRSRIIEMVVGNHLARFSSMIAPSDVFSSRDRTAFFRKKGTEQEVDFLVLDGDIVHPFEVKYRVQVKKSELGALFSIGHGALLTRADEWTYGEYAAVPVEYILTLI